MKVISNADKILREMDGRLKAACEVIGGMAESAAKDLAPVDTGLLRNSITHGMAGGKLSITQYASDDGSQTGQYADGNAPEDANGNKYVVIVGTNVYYAPYQELGAPNANVPPAPFLRPAMEGNKDTFKDVIEKLLKG